MFIACLYSVLALPLASCIVSLIISEKYSWLVTFTAPFLMLLSTLAAGVVFYWTWNQLPFSATWNWFTVDGYAFTIGILLNSLSALMLVVGKPYFLPC